MEALKLISIVCLILLNSTVYSSESLTVREYEHYQLWISCDENAAVAFSYRLGSDEGNLKRFNSFFDDVSINQDCKQTSRKPYSHHSTNLPKFDRGHLAAANHFDFDRNALKQDNFIVNALPQTVKLNRGAWKRTEELIECYRDRFALNTLGGVIWGSNSENDVFKTSHGIRTPDYYWRVISSEKGYFSAWVLPNTSDAKSANLNNYEISLEKLIDQIEYKEIRENLKALKTKQGNPFVYGKECKLYVS